MFYGETIQDTRRIFFSSWEKYKHKTVLQPLEEQLVNIILDHPEYHAILEQPELSVEATYFPELGQTNPFLHMGLHLAIREQVATNRPVGIALIYRELVKKYVESLMVEHLMMEVLAKYLWQAQRDQKAPDEEAYLRTCREIR